MVAKQRGNIRMVGYSMIVVSASLAIVGILQLFIGEDVLFSDKIILKKQEKLNKIKEEVEGTPLEEKIYSGRYTFSQIEKMYEDWKRSEGDSGS